jgi:DNA-binding winged helix-turn-helix (wHTH) protein
MDTSLEFSFDGWTLRRSTGELLKGDTRIRLPIQSARVLEELLSRPGELVTREALIATLWPRGVVEYETALNTIMHRLRVALDDHAEKPRYIETVPRRGYRFIGRLEPPAVEPARTATPARRMLPLRRAAAAASLALVLTAAGALATRLGAPDSGGGVDASDEQQAALEQQARARILLQRRGPGDVDRARRYFGAVLVTNPDDAQALAGSMWRKVERRSARASRR